MGIIFFHFQSQLNGYRAIELRQKIISWKLARKIPLNIWFSARNEKKKVFRYLCFQGKNSFCLILNFLPFVVFQLICFLQYFMLKNFSYRKFPFIFLAIESEHFFFNIISQHKRILHSFFDWFALWTYLSVCKLCQPDCIHCILTGE